MFSLVSQLFSGLSSSTVLEYPLKTKIMLFKY